MKTRKLLAGLAGVVGLLSGCASYPPGAERGPHGTMAYYVAIDANEPGVKIRANGQEVGTTPMTLKIWGDRDGTFHDFGSYEYIIQAIPNRTNQYVQTRVFMTGRMFTPEDKIPAQIHFDVNQPPPPTPTYVPVYPPAYYYGPPYYYYGPSFYFGPGYYRHYHRHGIRVR